MSVTLKRPMFRKGGEVMEGIMTGIKPRKMYDEGSLNTADQGIVDNVRRKMNLIDVVAGGGSAITDPLTQFLLQTGSNLIGGESAGGTKLQEIVGATRKPLASAIKAQQLKDAQNRKLATALISKSKPSEVKRLYNALKNTVNPDTGEKYTLNDVAVLDARRTLFQKDTSPEQKAYMKGKDTFKNLSSVKTFTGARKYEPTEVKLIDQANQQIDNNPELFAVVDESRPYVQREDLKGDFAFVDTGKKDAEGKEIKLEVVIPDDPDEYTGNRVYYVLPRRKFFYFDSQKNRLVEYKKGG